MHDHRRHSKNLGKVLKWSLVATVLFVVVEVIAGIKARSLALLSDAGHNVTDALALGLAWIGFYFQSKPANDQKTFGYHRAGILAAFVNALMLLALAGWIFYESYHRMLRPEQVHEWTMLVIATLGLAVNIAIMWGLRHDQAHDLNIRGAWAHMVGDSLSSVGIIIGAVAIHYTGWQRIDPALSILIGGLIVWTAWGIVKESLHILLEGTPKGLDLHSVTASMREIEGVIDVHDLHIWTLGAHKHALSSHVVIEDVPPSESESILRRLNGMLHDRFDIDHTTVQFEHVCCGFSESGCSMSGHVPPGQVL